MAEPANKKARTDDQDSFDHSLLDHLEDALKNANNELHGLFAPVGQPIDNMSDKALQLALRPSAVISKMYAMLMARHALGKDFHKQEAAEVKVGSSGWCAKWSSSQAVSSLASAGKYSAAVSIRHFKRTTRRSIDWEKVKMADEQLFSYSLIKDGIKTDLDFKAPFHCTMKDTSTIPERISTADELFELDKQHEILFGAIYSAWKAMVCGENLDPYTRCFQTSQVTIHLAEDEKDSRACRVLQQGQDALAEYEISKDSALDLAEIYRDMVDGIVQRGEKPTVKRILGMSDKAKWFTKTAAEQKFTERTLSAVKGILVTFIENKANADAIRSFNVFFGPDMLCTGYWHLDGIRNCCIDESSWIPQVLDRLKYYLRRGVNGCNAKRVSIDNIRGKPIGKNQDTAILGYAGLFGLHIMITQDVLTKVKLHDFPSICKVFEDSSEFEKAFPTSTYLMAMQRLGKSIQSDLPTHLAQCNEAQRQGCVFLEKLLSGEYDEYLRKAWVEIKGSMANTPEQLAAFIAGSDELTAAYNEVMHAVDFLTKNVVDKQDGISMSSIIPAPISSSDSGNATKADSSDPDAAAEWLCKASKNRMKYQQTIEKEWKKEEDVSGCLTSQFSEMKPVKSKRHVIIAIDVCDGPEQATSPWCKEPKLGAFTVRLIKGAVKCMRPGVFLFVGCGSHPRNKASIFQLLVDKKGDDGEELPMPTEISLVGQGLLAQRGVIGGGNAGCFQAGNVASVFGLASKACNWRTLKKSPQLLDSKKSSHANDMPLHKVPPRDQLQVTMEEKVAIWKSIEGIPHEFDAQNMSQPPEDKEERTKWKRRHNLNSLVMGYTLVSWHAVEIHNWMELYNVCKAPVTFVIDLWGGGGKKSAAAVSIPAQVRTVVNNARHAEHCLRVTDLQILKEFGRTGSFWHEKDSQDEIEKAFPSLFREDDCHDLDSDEGSGDEQQKAASAN